MKRIDSTEQKKIMYEILQYVDKVCRDNNIKYTLCGGSLIGAVREKKIIEWDDDVDIILTMDEYDKLIDILKKNNSERYKLLHNTIDKNYNFPFAKVVDTHTTITEKIMKNKVNDYGIFVDIFFYIPMSSNEKTRKKQFKKLKHLMKVSNETAVNHDNTNIVRKTARFLRNIYIKYYTSHRTIKWFNQIVEESKKIKNPKYQVACWPVYSYEKEIQNTSDISAGYMDAKFGPIKAMISKNYDTILSTTFGDYMTPPPIDQRRQHGIKAYWKEK